MTLAIRKLIILGIIATLIVLANFAVIANWLSDQGILDVAGYTLSTYLTAPTITILIALLILLVPGNATTRLRTSRCPVCEGKVTAGSRYCGECGSRV
jgi:hypothetical protein